MLKDIVGQDRGVGDNQGVDVQLGGEYGADCNNIEEFNFVDLVDNEGDTYASSAYDKASDESDDTCLLLNYQINSFDSEESIGVNSDGDSDSGSEGLWSDGVIHVSRMLLVVGFATVGINIGVLHFQVLMETIGMTTKFMLVLKYRFCIVLFLRCRE
ncbi:hypothetical protein OWV82_013548 [Melia azedarach]|uniref:Uncharacterized protein n=1 Tax=Melia azedarach TaxID=155640 RepID=A0ACC1XV64_MELAZ|nr:hypothetical protein OWV82_013548 [Melia azedarach]